MDIEKNRWWLQGLFWGAFMFIFMGVLLPLSQDEILTFGRTLGKLGYWLAIGLLYGRLMKWSKVGAGEKKVSNEGGTASHHD